MAVVFENTDAYKGRVYPFHVEPVQRDVMGYTLTNVAVGDVVPQGTPLVANDNDTNGKKTAVICKYAHITKKTSTTKFELDNIGFLKVGDKIFKSGQNSPTLSEIESIEGNKITLKAANSQLAVGDTVLEGKTVTESGESNDPSGDVPVEVVVPVSIPNRIAARSQKMTAIDKTISATHQALVIKNVLDYPVEWLNETTFPGSCLLKGCPLILFINQ
jgi:hypothetical protein